MKLNGWWYMVSLRYSLQQRVSAIDLDSKSHFDVVEKNLCPSKNLCLNEFFQKVHQQLQYLNDQKLYSTRSSPLICRK